MPKDYPFTSLSMPGALIYLAAGITSKVNQIFSKGVRRLRLEWVTLDISLKGIISRLTGRCPVREEFIEMPLLKLLSFHLYSRDSTIECQGPDVPSIE